MTPDKLTPASSKGAPPSAPAPPIPAPQNSSAGHSASALIAATGLPADKLSAAIVSFARFFSLPLKPELMTAIRRQALLPQTQAEPAVAEGAGKFTMSDADTTAKSRQSLALAAAAAESKGVELSPQGLESFAGAVDPDQKRRNSEGHGRRRDKDPKDQENSSKTGPISAASLREMALKSAEKDPLLAILNRLPAKNGQRWVALPFSFCEEGRKFSVALRILLENDRQAGLMALDIAESGPDEHERSWLFVMDNRKLAARNTFSNGRLAVYLEPELSPSDHDSFIGELSRLMEIPPERISIKKRAEPFPCEADLAAIGGRGDLLRSVNEAV